MQFDHTTETIHPNLTSLLTIAGAGAIEIPTGTTEERPVDASAGAIRYNTTIGSLEVRLDNSTWVPLVLGTSYVTRETPSGAIDGVNVTFTLANTPITGSEHVYVNGLLQEPGAASDYTISGSVITLTFVPEIGSKIVVTYRI